MEESFLLTYLSFNSIRGDISIMDKNQPFYSHPKGTLAHYCLVFSFGSGQ